nr:phosphotransferase [Cellulomonas hominis]
MALAALATVAVPGFDAREVRPGSGAGDDDVALVTDGQRRHWVVRAPRSAAAGAALEAELVLLAAVAEQVDAGRLPFDVPRVAGAAPLEEGGRVVVHRELPGRPVVLDRLQPGPGTAAALGRAIGALHELPVALVEDAGLPVYDAAAYRQRRQAEVDEAARTGRVPATLLRRWEERLEDVSLWRFSPTVVHGDLSADHVLVADGGVTGVVAWGEAKVADPADDLAWLLVAAPQDAVDSIMEAYQLRRTELTDPHLADRALLAGELALARWLLYGVRSGDDDVVADAVQMLDELDEQTRDVAEPGAASV